MLPILALLALAIPTADDSPTAGALAAPILAPGTTLVEVQAFVEARIPAMPEVETAADWTARARKYREDAFAKVIFRGEAERWRSMPTAAEFVGDIEGGPGYRIRKLRYEVVPGLHIPALLYEPTDLRGKVPVILNVNGHDAKGKAADYKQVRCINLAKRGMIALNLEWFGMGQLGGKGFAHDAINAIDLCGTSGIALHYLAMSRGLDVLLSHENADPSRVGVTGLSGGGWQTIFISSFDERVTLADPVAGYSSFRTRVREFSDLGDSEQTPSDLATVVDYAHMTAMRAPHPTLLTFNGKDNCCFAAPHALPPLREAAAPIFRLFGVEGNLRAHVNMDPGDHNYGLDNRQAFYQFTADHWSRPGQTYNPREIPSDAEVKSAEALNVELPPDNLDFRKLADALAKDLPRGEPTVDRLRSLVRPIEGEISAKEQGEATADEMAVRRWVVKVGDAWSVPVVAIAKPGAKGTTILLGDEGRAKLADRARELAKQDRNVLVVDLYGFGEAKTPSHEYLFGLLIGTVGARPLGVECGQLGSVAAWAKSTGGAASDLEAVGPRSGVIALTSAALWPDRVASVTIRGPMTNLKEVVATGRSYATSPELFAFGLLEGFDLPQIEALIAPRPVTRLP